VINIDKKKIDIRISLIYLISLVLIIMAPFTRGFVTSLLNGFDLSELSQGQLAYRTVRIKDIDDQAVREWILLNYREKGLYEIYSQEDNAKYILVSAGKRGISGIRIEIDSIEAIKDKIIVNGRAVSPGA